MNKKKTSHASNLFSEVIATKNLDAAFNKVYRHRSKGGPNSDIWSLSLNWQYNRAELQNELLSGRYQLSPVEVFHTEEGYFTRWCSQRCCRAKAISQILAPIIGEYVGYQCHHLKGQGGLKGAIQNVEATLPRYQYIIKSDVHQFYESMNHSIVLDHCQKIIKDKRILTLIAQTLNRCEVLNGNHHLITQGIPKGCPLSPLMGALILKSQDACIPDHAFYARYRDDWVILVKTRSQLRRIVKKMHRVMMHQLGFKLAVNKTFIGRICKGFDFLGYRFNAQGIGGLATKTVLHFIERITRLYEQGATKERIRLYVRRWLGWLVCHLLRCVLLNSATIHKESYLAVCQ